MLMIWLSTVRCAMSSGAFRPAPFYGRRDPREGIGGGPHQFRDTGSNPQGAMPRP
jgi:hypothetical protein